MPCSNAAKTRNQLKFARVPQTPKPIWAVSGPKFTILRGHVEDVLLFNKLFQIVDMFLSCEDRAQQNCAMVPRSRFLATISRPVFSASRMQHVSDLHLKFALRPHHVWKYGRHPLRLGKEKTRKTEDRRQKTEEEETTVQKYNGLPYSIGRP